MAETIQYPDSGNSQEVNQLQLENHDYSLMASCQLPADNGLLPNGGNYGSEASP